MRPTIPELGLVVRGRSGRNAFVLIGYLLFLVVIVLVHARVFQYMMAEYENQPDHSFINGLYWTITTMTTLGFGDITFVSHAGKLFSAWVTLSGFVFLLILLPFGVVSVVFAPWLENILRYRPRTRLKHTARGHVIICGWDPVAETLSKSLKASGVAYVTTSAETEEVRRLEEVGITAVHGDPTDAEVLKRLRIASARMVIANMNDPDNANLTLTVRSLGKTPVAAVVTQPERADLLKIAGATHVIPLRQTLGSYLAVRATPRGAAGHVVDSFGDLRFTEIPSHGTPFVGKTLANSEIREKTGVSVIGVWEHGRFFLPEPSTLIKEGMVLLLVGTDAALDAFRKAAGNEGPHELVLILGYGTVGSAAASVLRRMAVPHVVIDREADPDTLEPQLVHADASDLMVLESAGIREAGGLIVTTNDDGMNVFLTLASRHLNPHIRIAARANREANVTELYSAGADFVVSHSSVGASILTNLIVGRKNVFLAEGVHLFWRQVPASLHGRTLGSSGLRSVTGATVVAIQHGRDTLELDLASHTVLDRSTALIMVGTPESEALFANRYGKDRRNVSSIEFEA